MSRHTWGTITQRSQLDRHRRATWQLQWTEHGHRRSRTVHDATRRECEAMLADIRSHVDDSSPHVPTCSEVWRSHSLDDLAASTRVHYRAAWDADVSPRWASIPVCDVHRPDIQTWLDIMPAPKAKLCRAVLSRILRDALAHGYVDSVETRDTKLHTAAPAMTRATLTADEVATLDAACTGSLVEPIYILCVHAGLRPGEARAVRPDDIRWSDLDGSRELCVRVARTAAASSAIADELGSDCGPTKTRSSTRTAIVCALQSRLWSLACAAAHRGDTYLTDDGFGSPLHESTVRVYWERLCAFASVPYVPLRNLRATFVTLAHDSGIPLDAVSEQVGHASPSITARVYNRPTDDQRATQFSRALRRIAADSHPDADV